MEIVLIRFFFHHSEDFQRINHAHFECCLGNNSTFVCKNDLTIFVNLIVKFTPPSQILFSRAESSKEQLSQSSFYANLLYATPGYGVACHLSPCFHVYLHQKCGKRRGDGCFLSLFLGVFVQDLHCLRRPFIIILFLSFTYGPLPKISPFLGMKLAHVIIGSEKGRTKKD